MKTIAIVFASFCVVGVALAQTAPAPAPAPAPAAPAPAAPAAAVLPSDAAGATCLSTIGPKNLKGAALKSSATKCCKTAAKAAKLAGAAATSFTKKCVSDVIPPAPPKS
jgi:hypothetical protein